MKKLFIFFFMAMLIAAGCKDSKQEIVEENYNTVNQNYDGDYEKSEVKDMTGDELTPPPPPDPQQKPQDIIEPGSITQEEIAEIGKKIIKNATISIEVNDYKESVDRIKDVMKKYDCYVSNELENTYDTYITSTITIRVKYAQFDSLLNEILDGDQTVISKNIYVNDVTSTYVDLYQRLKNKKLVEQQYNELLKKAYTIDDILMVTQYVRQIREEIESTEGQMLLINDQAKYSTIVLTITKSHPETIAKTKFGNMVWEGMQYGWKGVQYLVIAIFTIWPVWIIVGIIIFVVRKQMKKKSKQVENNQQK